MQSEHAQRMAIASFLENVPEGFWAGRSLALETLVKRARRHADGVPYPELLCKFAKRDWRTLQRLVKRANDTLMVSRNGLFART